MGFLSDKDREAVLTKARADRERQGLPPTVEDVGTRKRIGALLIRVREAGGKRTATGRQNPTTQPVAEDSPRD
jgi:hypothetical protein